MALFNKLWRSKTANGGPPNDKEKKPTKYHCPSLVCVPLLTTVRLKRFIQRLFGKRAAAGKVIIPADANIAIRLLQSEAVRREYGYADAQLVLHGDGDGELVSCLFDQYTLESTDGSLQGVLLTFA